MSAVACRPIAAGIGGVLAASCLLGEAQAGNVADVIADLYGGDGIILAPTPPPFPSHAPHFAASSLGGLSDLGSAITSNAGQFSFNSAITGFTFDIERGVPVRTTDSLGPILAERAETIGANKISIAAAYSRIAFTRFEGTDLDDLSLVFTHDDVNGDGVLGPATAPFSFELDQIQVDIDLDLTQDVLAFFATYGITSAWDVGIVVPLIRSSARAEANATIIRNSPISNFVHNFDPAGEDQPRSVIDRDAAGVGDVILRTKYHFLRDPEDWPEMAVVGRVKLPTGDEDDLLGTGETDVLGLLVASKTFGQVTPHLNLGYEVSTESELSNVRYVAGFDFAAHEKLTLAFGVLGRWEPAGDDIGDHLVDLAMGVKWNPVADLILSANLQVPLNWNEGLRPTAVGTLGIEWPF